MVLVFSVVAFANEQKKFDEEIYRAEQHKYIKCQAKLSCEEAKSFFAIFDEMRAKEREMFDKLRPYRQGNFPGNDAECRKALMDFDNTELQLKKIQRDYHLKMLKVVSASKLVAALHAAADFDRKKYREWNKGNQRR